jgi:outer membrane protein assembly factor BamB
MATQLPAPVVEVGDGGGRVYAANDSGAVFCLDLKTGRKIVWQKVYVPPTGDHDDAVLLRNEPLLEHYDWGKRLIIASNDGGVHCFDPETGKIDWSFDVPTTIHCRPLALKPEDDKIQQPVVLVGCDEAYVYALDARTGALVWKLRTRGAAVGLVKSPDGVLVISSDGVMQKFTPR